MRAKPAPWARRAGNRNAGRTVRREAVNAGGNGREGDGAEAVLPREREAVAVAGGEQRVLGPGVAPDGSDRVDDMARGQPVAGGDARLAGRAAAERPAFRQQFGPGSAVNGPRPRRRRPAASRWRH